MRYLIIILLFSCTVINERSIDPRLEYYISVYEKEAIKRNHTPYNLLIASVQTLGKDTLGLARPSEILISEKVYNTQDTLEIEAVFMHEIGHALYGLKHSDCSHVTLMCSMPNNQFYKRHRELVLDELFSVHDQGAN